MDFSTQYTAEQEDFRKEVQAWIEANVPEDKKSPVDPEGLTSGQEGDNADLYWFWREKHKELAEKGWLYPTYPKEYGGGGLGGEHETIIEEEFSKGGVVRGFTNGLVFPTLLVWGTEEQKQKFLTPLLKAETVAFQNFTEPNAGSDLASLQSRATRDGDDWIISGQKQFVSGAGVPDILFGPMVTDPDAPRHRNLGFFLIENPSDGLQIGRMGLLGGSRQNRIFMDNVRVSGENLIGGDHQGWQVTQTTLEQEHGGRGQAFPRDEALENLMDYVKNTDHGDGKGRKRPRSASEDHGQRPLLPHQHPVREAQLRNVPGAPGDELSRLPELHVWQDLPFGQRPQAAGHHGSQGPPGHRGAGRSLRWPHRGEPEDQPSGPAPGRNRRGAEGHHRSPHRHQPDPGASRSHAGHGHPARQLETAQQAPHARRSSKALEERGLQCRPRSLFIKQMARRPQFTPLGAGPGIPETLLYLCLLV